MTGPTPSLAVQLSQRGFKPRRWLANAHLQTIAGNFQRRDNLLPEPEERLFPVAPEVQVLCLCHWQRERRQRPTVVIVHGLEGSARSTYVVGTSSLAWQRGWNVVRMNIRSCGGTERYCHTLYNSGLSADVRALAGLLTGAEGLPQIMLVGFSMGGNQVLKAMAEWGRESPPQVMAAAAISPSADLSLCADRIHRPSNYVYEWWFLHSLIRSLKRKARLFPTRIQVPTWWKITSIRAFDELVTAPQFGFLGAEDYYTRASSSRLLEHIARPTMVIHALDDPFVELSAATEAKLHANPWITYRRCRHGGHCAFLEDTEGPGDAGRWAEKRAVEFLAHALGEV